MCFAGSPMKSSYSIVVIGFEVRTVTMMLWSLWGNHNCTHSSKRRTSPMNPSLLSPPFVLRTLHIRSPARQIHVVLVGDQIGTDRVHRRMFFSPTFRTQEVDVVVVSDTSQEEDAIPTFAFQRGGRRHCRHTPVAAAVGVLVRRLRARAALPIARHAQVLGPSDARILRAHGVFGVGLDGRARHRLVRPNIDHCATPDPDDCRCSRSGPGRLRCREVQHSQMWSR